MAGIGVRLNKLFEKRSMAAAVVGIGYSTAVTITPMVVVIACVVLMQKVLGFSTLTYVDKEIFLCSMLYIFIFGLLTTSVFSSVISKFIADVIFEERYEDIMPCYYMGLALNMVLAGGAGAAFCIRALIVGRVSPSVIFAAFMGYMALVFVFYTMTYLSVCKTYEKIMLFYLVGMVAAFLLSLLFRFIIGMSIETSMLLAVASGLIITGSLALAVLRQYFKMCSKNYCRIFGHLRKYWKLIVANTAYTLGLYVHNFVFWKSELGISVENTFIYAETYDLASCIAMFTNISASVILLANIEMHFNQSYKEYSEAVIGGRYADIEKTKNRMFGRLVSEIMSIARIQFIISTVMYLVFSILLPRFGFNGLVMTIYPVMAAAYFVVFIMYAAFIFLYYFDDLTGAMRTGIIFCVVTFIGSLVSMQFQRIWYGMGIFAGAVAGWTYSYFRLRWVEKNIDVHIFCRGDILRRKRAKRPSGISYRKNA